MNIKDHKFINRLRNLSPRDLGVVSLLAVVFITTMYFNFRSKKDEAEKPKSETTSGMNTTVPDPSTPEINGGKLKQTPTDSEERTVEIVDVSKNKEAETATDKVDISKVNTAYKGASKTASNFYSRPKVDHEKIRMQAEIEELKAEMQRHKQVEEVPSADKTIEDQFAIIERSYELAAKYSAKQEPQSELIEKSRSEVSNISQTSTSVVSSLTPTSDATFSTAVGNVADIEKNTISACIHSDQTITNGGAVKIRLLESMLIGGFELPKGATITGQSRVSGERLSISISQIERRGRIIPVELQIIDTDGAEGIFIPNSMEVSALKKIVANMGKDAGSSVSITNQGAGAELLADIGKSAISGVAEYANDKIKEVRVHLKAGYKIMLYQAEK